MVPMMSLMRLELLAISAITSVTLCMASPPWCAVWVDCWASWAAWAEVPAFCSTVLVICSMKEAVCCTLAAERSVRSLRSILPLAISSTAERTLITCWLTSSISQRNINPSWLMVRMVMPISSTRSTGRALRLLPVATSSACWRNCSMGRANWNSSSTQPRAQTATSMPAMGQLKGCTPSSSASPSRLSAHSPSMFRRTRVRTDISLPSDSSAPRPVRTRMPLCRRTPLAWPWRMALYKASACSICCRSALVRTDM